MLMLEEDLLHKEEEREAGQNEHIREAEGMLGVPRLKPFLHLREEVHQRDTEKDSATKHLESQLKSKQEEKEKKRCQIMSWSEAKSKCVQKVWKKWR